MLNGEVIRQASDSSLSYELHEAVNQKKKKNNDCTDRSQVAEIFYSDHVTKPFFDDLIDYMTSGDVIALCLARKDGIEFWRYLLGPTRVSEARALKRRTIRGMAQIQ